MNTKCMFCVISQGFESKYKAMLDSFLKYNKGWDIVLFYPGHIDVPGITKQVDITGLLDSYPAQYSMKWKIWSFRAEATALCLKDYIGALYCDSDLMFYSQLPSFDRTTFTLHLLHGYTDQDLNHFCRTGFINTGIYYTDNTESSVRWFQHAARIFKDSSLTRMHHRDDRQVWDQTLYIFLPWIQPTICNLDTHDGINVAFWNLHQRKLSKRDDKYFVNEEPLICFHFSLLGKTAGYAQRDPVLMQLYQDYVSRIS